MAGRRTTALVLSLVCLGAPASAGAAPTATGSGGAASTVDRLATRAAIETLRDGGNAVDAAITAAGVLGVTEPFSSGIGGGGFMLVRTPDGQVSAIDGRETAPDAMRPRSFFEAGEPLDFDTARYSGLSAGVPGTVATWDEALERYGSRSLERLLRPAIAVAQHGFRIDRTFFGQVELNAEFFAEVPATESIYLDPDGTPRNVGTRQRNPELARAYRRIARLGAGGFYRGPIAKSIAEAAQDPPVDKEAETPWLPGLLTEADLRRYRALVREPTRVSYRGFDVWGMPPPSSGGSTVGEALNILEGYAPLGADRAQALHRFIEASRFAFADRNAYLGDPAFFDVPLAGLLSDSFAAERRALITDQAADSEAVAPGEPADNPPPGRVGVDREGTSTTHLTVADASGMTVSYTFTIESTGGNGIVVPRWGFLLNNELTDFDYDDPGHPNAPAGGKRPRSSMAPTIVTLGGVPVLALGSPGGSTIITTVLQVLIERLDLGRTLPEAIAAPRAAQGNSPETPAERAFRRSAEGQALAATYGHEFIPVPSDPPEIGATTAIEFLPGGAMLAAAEPKRRGGGSAMVVAP